MSSVFPGMDPYLENAAIWPDFHGTFLIGLRAELNRLLPRNYVARWERYVWIDDPDAEQLRILGEPDAFVSDKIATDPAPEARIQLAAPAVITLPVVEPKGKGFIKIIDVR